MVPPPGIEPGAVAATGVWRYDSPGAYVADSPGIIRPFIRVGALYDSGFTEGTKTELSIGSGR